MNRHLWLLGLLLLAGSLVGAGWAFNQSPPGAANRASVSTSPAGDSAAEQPPLVMAIGYVDGKAGVSRLYPLQQGRVIDVVGENTHVDKGKPILTLDDELARLKAAEAQADLDNSEAQLQQTAKLQEQQALKIEQQKAAVTGAERKRSAAENERLAKAKSASAAGIDVNPALLEAMKQTVEQLDELIRAEKAKLRELQLYDPDLDVRRAKANRAAKKGQLEEAEWVRKQCTLVAPESGTVLRTYVSVGEVLGSNPTRPAVEFLPDGPLIVRGELLQEWAHRVKVGQDADIVDDTYQGPTWKGKIYFLAPWFAQKRNLIIEPFMYNDVRYQECLVEVLDKGEYPLRVGQRVRVKIKAP
jgi:multidrug resistance efflux pump